MGRLFCGDLFWTLCAKREVTTHKATTLTAVGAGWDGAPTAPVPLYLFLRQGSLIFFVGMSQVASDGGDASICVQEKLFENRAARGSDRARIFSDRARLDLWPYKPAHVLCRQILPHLRDHLLADI